MTRRHFVYWMFDADGDCLYIGITIQPTARWKTHRRRFGTEVAAKRMAGPYTEPVARRIEREQRAELRPKYDGYWGKRRPRRPRAYPAGSVYRIAEAARLFGMPEELLQQHAGSAKFIHIPDDNGEAA